MSPGSRSPPLSGGQQHLRHVAAVPVERDRAGLMTICQGCTPASGPPVRSAGPVEVCAISRTDQADCRIDPVGRVNSGNIRGVFPRERRVPRPGRRDAPGRVQRGPRRGERVGIAEQDPATHGRKCCRARPRASREVLQVGRAQGGFPEGSGPQRASQAAARRARVVADRPGISLPGRRGSPPAS